MKSSFPAAELKGRESLSLSLSPHTHTLEDSLTKKQVTSAQERLPEQNAPWGNVNLLIPVQTARLLSAQNSRTLL